MPPVPTGPGLFRGRGPWWEGDTLRYNVGRQNLQEAATLTYELKYRPGGMSDRIEGSPNATVSDTTLSGTVSLEADQSVQLAFRIVDNSIVDDPRDTLMLTVREGPHTYIDRLVVHEGICDRAVPLQTAVLSWLRHGLGVVSTSNVLNPDITPCREPTSRNLPTTLRHFPVQFSDPSFPPLAGSAPSTAVTGSARLIQTSTGSSGALGGPPTKRSGRAA